ncbi:rod shape determining protein RodA [Saccharicrinis carchari]|uniref:Cell wall polymerase n=1 Tax=Saccharicrinis carchari TaxID=1168039 RepID=A0A521D4P1_SACCC|nr:rod shape-determining protein RodA [Saccharicrinis carchari]SMO66686.1 rod shape determining protein RodA [Saccharicrinis carchari]
MAQNNYSKKVDWLSTTIYLILVIFGWFNIYAANYNPENPVFFDPGKEYAKQLIWIGLSLIIIWVIFMTDSKFYVAFSYFLYGTSVFLLFSVIFFGKEINGAKSWFEIGPLRFQPVELAKIATALTFSRIMSRHNFSFDKPRNVAKILGIWTMPVLCIFLQNDTGSALVFFAFILPFYREGLTGNILIFGILAAIVAILTLVYTNTLILSLVVAGAFLFLLLKIDKKIVAMGGAFFSGGFILSLAFYALAGFKLQYELFTVVGIATVSVYLLIKGFVKNIKPVLPIVIFLWGLVTVTFSADYFVDEVLSQYQRNRIYVLLGFKDDPLGAGYNVNQSKIAIGSGGLTGKGYLQGTQTKFDFVPEQSTDFIFCTVGEEWGYLGTFGVVMLFLILIFRLIYLAEKQHSAFSRVYGYCVASLFFYHFAINIGMTIGLAPVIGIPLPFFSYGGSSLWGFTTLLFIFLKLDTNRNQLIR